MMLGDEASELSGVTAHARPGALARDCEYFFGRPNWREGGTEAAEGGIANGLKEVLT